MLKEKLTQTLLLSILITALVSCAQKEEEDDAVAAADKTYCQAIITPEVGITIGGCLDFSSATFPEGTTINEACSSENEIFASAELVSNCPASMTVNSETRSPVGACVSSEFELDDNLGNIGYASVIFYPLESYTMESEQGSQEFTGSDFVQDVCENQMQGGTYTPVE